VVFYGEHAGFAIQAENIGRIYWVGDLARDTFSLGPNYWDANAWLPPAQTDTTAEVRLLKQKRPLTLSAAYSYQWNAPAGKPVIVHRLAHYLYGAVSYRQVLKPVPGTAKGARFSLGLSSGMLNGYMPVRMGWNFGGSEGYSSVVGLGAKLGNPVLDISFKAVGSPIFVPKRGFEISGGLSGVWGFDRDWDNDRVIDKKDKCEGPREDRDGFEDEDGCPEPDNDHDTFLDRKDKCPNNAEDFDGFSDLDGCPDYDNDNDSLPDSVDECPDAAEDFDGFEDWNGCPDPDNDSDMVPDTTDACRDTAEDRDAFRDEDGCPDYDNDNDGFADTVDSCPNAAEDVDSFEDSDGCPDLDNDSDMVPDAVDACRDTAEDRDGFRDEDGCPDWDNDKDNIADTVDSCPNAAEDFDGFEDWNGCPDPDNDSDMVPDTTDACRDTAEDIDGFRDEDGCPDWDNDKDNIADTVDSCPNAAEDFDGFKDTDGCPDLDNDNDSIPDAADECPDKPETYNRYKDGDGCPDRADTAKTPVIPKPTLPAKPVENDTVARSVNAVIANLLFKPYVAVLEPLTWAFLDSAVSVLKAIPEKRFEIQGHCDSLGSSQTNIRLSMERAEIVRSYLVGHGIDPNRLVCVGYGSESPVASNKTAEGRALNRRVVFATIDSDEWWNELRQIELKQKKGRRR
jgi:outer membrane protein OmpA-like peptidoglycan-associated protein